MIEDAQSQTKSNMAAARWLGVSYLTYRKYAKMYGLFEKHLNPSSNYFCSLTVTNDL